DVELVVRGQLLARELDPDVLDDAARVVRIRSAERDADEAFGEALAARTVNGCVAVDGEAAPVALGYRVAVATVDVGAAGHDDRVGGQALGVDLRAALEDERRRGATRRRRHPDDERARLDGERDRRLDEDEAVDVVTAAGLPRLGRVDAPGDVL